jgi:methylated-DNA-[protein]-cysteine S-methyltransferase
MRAEAPSNLQVEVVETALGWIALASTKRGLTRLTFGHAMPQSAVAALAILGPVHQGRLSKLATSLRRYADGRDVDFRPIELDFGDMSPFQARVIDGCRNIPYGQTLSYGQLAAVAGSPRAARAVGNVMSHIPVPLIVPCHRVLASGATGGYSAGEGVRMKLRLLELERPRAKRPVLAGV